MTMDFGPQKPGEHDFTYAARILKAAGTKFEALLANDSFSLQDLRDIKEQVESVIRRKIDYVLNDKPAPGVEAVETRLAAITKRLVYREQEVVKLRCGIGLDDRYSVEEVARIFKITRARARQIAERGFRNLTKLLRLEPDREEIMAYLQARGVPDVWLM